MFHFSFLYFPNILQNLSLESLFKEWNFKFFTSTGYMSGIDSHVILNICLTYTSFGYQLFNKQVLCGYFRDAWRYF